eukprot:Selendium_serpulae@DN6280_c0_g1_i1.p1
MTRGFLLVLTFLPLSALSVPHSHETPPHQHGEKPPNSGSPQSTPHPSPPKKHVPHSPKPVPRGPHPHKESPLKVGAQLSYLPKATPYPQKRVEPSPDPFRYVLYTVAENFPDGVPVPEPMRRRLNGGYGSIQPLYPVDDSTREAFVLRSVDRGNSWQKVNMQGQSFESVQESIIGETSIVTAPPPRNQRGTATGQEAQDVEVFLRLVGETDHRPKFVRLVDDGTEQGVETKFVINDPAFDDVSHALHQKIWGLDITGDDQNTKIVEPGFDQSNTPVFFQYTLGEDGSVESRETVDPNPGDFRVAGTVETDPTDAAPYPVLYNPENSELIRTLRIREGDTVIETDFIFPTFDLAWYPNLASLPFASAAGGVSRIAYSTNQFENYQTVQMPLSTTTAVTELFNEIEGPWEPYSISTNSVGNWLVECNDGNLYSAAKGSTAEGTAEGVDDCRAAVFASDRDVWAFTPSRLLLEEWNQFNALNNVKQVDFQELEYTDMATGELMTNGQFVIRRLEAAKLPPLIQL